MTLTLPGQDDRQGHLFEPAVFAEIRERSLSAADRGRQFEELMRAAFEANPEYDFEAVWLWDDWPQRKSHGFGADIGIDLVARQRNGDLWAIQCKFYDGTTVPTSGIASFLSTALGKHAPFDQTLLVTTGRVTDAARTKLRNAGTRLVDLAELDGWDVDWRACWADPGSLQWGERKTPREHQQDALDAISKGFQEHRRGTLVLPCGTGKSLVAMWAAEELAGAGGQVLYAVPSIALMGQTMREWAQNRTVRHQYIGVCSDPSTGKMPRGAAEDIASVTMPVSTRQDDIAQRLSLPVPHDEMRVVLTTYQSLPAVAGAIRKANDTIRADGHVFSPFDLFVCDEAHRTTGIESAERKADQATGFHLAHDDTALPARCRLYMTATPRVFTAAAKQKAAVRSTAAGRDLDSFSMDDETVYGPRFHEMTFSEAIDRELLTDYRVLIVAKRADRFEHGDAFVEVLRAEDSQGKTAARGGLVAEGYATKLLGVLDAMAAPRTTGAETGRVSGEISERTGDPLRTAILFTNTVNRSKTVAERGRYPELLGDDTSLLEAISADLHSKHPDRDVIGIRADHMDGSTRAGKRARQIGWLRDTAQSGTATCRVLSNSRVLSEGVDVPSLDAVVFMDPRRSAIDVTQAVGRAIRKSPGKEHGYIVIPVVVPEHSELDDETVLRGRGFDVVWEVVRALRSHDDRVDLWLTDLVEPPITVRPDPCLGCDRDSCRWCNQPAPDPDDLVGPQELPFPQRIKQELERQVFSRMIDVCGDKQMWPTWGKNAAEVCEQVRRRLNVLLSQPHTWARFCSFVAALRETAGPHVTDADALEMVAQHVVTIPIFDALFADSGFAKENPMSRAMDGLLARLGDIPEHEAVELAGFGMAQRLFEAELKPLTRAYKTMRDMLSADITPTRKVDLMREIYDGFFQHAMKATTEKLGVVYTPVEIVDFMIRASDTICRKHFDRGLTDEGVNILEPFTGTGTFLHQMLTIDSADRQPIIRDEDLARKYGHELHATELVLLAYYVAALKIEAGMEARDGFADGQFSQFANIVHGDTFLINDTAAGRRLEGVDDNTQAARDQAELPIWAIISNPPWSSGQDGAQEDNENLQYPALSERVRDTYSAAHRELTGRAPGGNSAGNLYVKAIRWATDRIGHPRPAEAQSTSRLPGIVAFVHPSSLATGTALAGMRSVLRDEFTDIYVVNLRGDAYKSGDEFAREGDKIFGGGSRNAAQVTFLVRDPSRVPEDGAARLHYAEVPEYCDLDAKFEWLAGLAPGTESFWDRFDEVPVNGRHDWVNLTDGSFDELPIPVCLPGHDSDVGVAVRLHARGVATSCDAYVYDFDRDELIVKMQAFIAAYERARRAVHERRVPLEVATANDEVDVIKWHQTLRQSVKANKRIEFDETRIRRVLYRPFQQMWLYEDDRILSSVKTVAKMFPTPQHNTDEDRSVSGPTQAAGGGFSSAAHPRGHASEPSPADAYPISTTSTEAGERSPGNDSREGPGSGGHAGCPCGDELPSRPESSLGECAGIESGPASDATAIAGGGAHRPNPTASVRSRRNRMAARPMQHRSANTSRCPQPAILISGTSNMTFQALASNRMPDLAAIKGSQQTRTLPR